MKIFYAVQATGNGHLSRAQEIIPFLSKYGEVDVFLSGNNYSLKTDLPIAYRSKGLSLQYNKRNGSVDLLKTALSFNLKKIWQEASQLPIENYDLILNDFECITSLACKIKNIPSIHFGHQASFTSKKVPRPDKTNPAGEWVLSHYAQGTQQLGLHFESYDEHILNPIIKTEIINAEPIDKGHITVYLGHVADELIEKQLTPLKDHQFEVFSPQIKSPCNKGHIRCYPTNPALFNMSLLNSKGIITGSGFETPAEALYLNKKLMVLPMKGQYEQQCNAAALKDYQVAILQDWNQDFSETFDDWINGKNQRKLTLAHSTTDIIERLMTLQESMQINRKKVQKTNAGSIRQQFQFWEQSSHQSSPTS
jgi:uncharacterized protein (TIGR00661 family)